MNFFIVGYPKAGTTSLYDYLKSHPGVFLPDIKEPHFHTVDFPGAREVSSLEDYQKLYSDALPSQIRGDASASVIHSDVALDRILELYPDARFILLVREPVASVSSFHGELLNNLNENIFDLEAAWSLQEARKNGTANIPATCKEQRFLQYRSIYNYRKQIPFFVNKVPEAQRLILVFEEFYSDPRAGYLKVLEFLGLEDDRRKNFDAVNVAKSHRYRWLAVLHRRLVNGNGFMYRVTKWLFNKIGVRPSNIISSFNVKPAVKKAITNDFKTKLHAIYQEDVSAIENALGREIKIWRQ